jgi:hypothetical protein
MKIVGNWSVTSGYMKVCAQLQAQAALTLEKNSWYLPNMKQGETQDLL